MILFEAEDAYNLAQQGYYLTRAGYTYGNGTYFAFGTFPGCLRAGTINLDSFKGKQWKLLTFEDIIKEVGFFPTTVGTLYSRLEKGPYGNEALCQQMDMIRFMINSKYTDKDFHDSFKAKDIWTEFFDSKEERDKEKCYPV